MESDKLQPNDDEVTKPDVPQPDAPNPEAFEQTVTKADVSHPDPADLAMTQPDLNPPDDTGRSNEEQQAETLVDSAAALGPSEEDSQALYQSIMQFSVHLSESGMMSNDDVNTMTLNGEELAKALVDKKKLTHYQLEQLRKGKGGSLVLGNYVIMEKIGAGGMGVVFKARHRRMKRDVAVKVLPEAMTRSSEALARFHREVEMAAKLHHPNIASAFDADEAEGLHFLVMEYVDGPDLSRYVKEYGPLPLRYAVALGIQAAHGLKQAHDLGVIHRDVKPGNLLVNQKGTLKILDMGLAHVLAADEGPAATELTQSGRVMGTVDYMAPEQAKDAKRADHRADVYSLGCTLYYLATGKALSPKGSITEKLLWHQNEEKPPLSASCPSSTEKLDAVVAQMLAKDADQRQQSMEEVGVQLSECLKDIPTSGDRPTITGPLAAISISENPISGSSISDFATKFASSAPHESPIESPSVAKGKIAAIAAAAVALVIAAILVVPQFIGNDSPPGPVDPNDDGATGQTPQGGTTAGTPATDGTTTGSQIGNPDQVNEIVSELNEQVAWIFDLKGELSVVTSAGLERHAITSLDELPKVPYTVLGVKLTGVQVGDDDVKRLEGVTGLQQLDLSDSQVTDAGLAVVQKLTGLWRLKLGGTKIGDDGINHVASLASLRDLTLEKSMISDAALAKLSGLPALENVFLADTAVTDDGVGQLTRLANLRHLSLLGTKVTTNGMFLLYRKLPKLDVEWDGADPERSAARKLIDKGAVVSLETTDGEDLVQVTKTADLPAGHFRVKVVDLSDKPNVANGDLGLLKGLKHVAEIHLDGTAITDDGVASLAKIKSLRKIDLGALQIAPGPIALVKQELPGIAIIEKQTDQWKTANWVLQQGGNVTAMLPDGRELSGIVNPIQLPKGKFSLTAIHIVDNPKIVDADLEQVRGLSQLKVLNVAGSSVTDAGIAHVIGCTQLRDLDLSRTKITNVGTSLIARIQSLRQLHVAGTEMSGAGLQHLNLLAALTHLSLAQTKVVDDDIILLKGINDLQWLSLSGTGITDAAQLKLAELKSLQELHVDNSKTTDAGLEELRKRLPDCKKIVGDEPDKQRLALRWVVTLGGVGTIAGADGAVEIREKADVPRDDCRLLSVDVRDLGTTVSKLDFLNGCTDLQILNLVNTDIDNRAVEDVGNLTSLTHLYLANTNIRESGLAPLSQLKNLEVLDLSGRSISSAGLKHLSGLTKLRGLKLDSCQLSNTTLRSLQQHKGLELLTLNSNLNISDQGIAHLSALSELKHLELASTSVSDGALEHITGFKKLQILNLAGAKKLSDPGGVLGSLPQLRWIRLRGTKVGDATLQAMADKKSLNYVDVVRTEVSEGTVGEFKKANPAIKVLNGKDDKDDRKLQEPPADAQRPRQVPIGGGLFQ
jgi:serine/threonine protein kinase/Leucine-rich repeat (LRR) protein